MKRLFVVMCALCVVFVFVGTAAAIPVSLKSLRITDSRHLVSHEIEWNTFPSRADNRSPIGVALDTSSGLENQSDKTIDILLNHGDSIFLYSESFQTQILVNLFKNVTYHLFASLDSDSSETDLGTFSFDPTGQFSANLTRPSFTLSFLGFTGDLVHRFVDSADFGLSPGGDPDAVYQLTYNASSVPEPGTLLLLGSGLTLVAAFGRRLRKRG